MDYLKKDIARGDQWLEELSLDELQEVAEKVAVNSSNKRIKEMILDGKIITPEQQKEMIEMIKTEFMKGGRKKFIKAVEGEFKKVPLKVKFSIANKQKNLFEMTSKLNNVFRTLFNPQILQMVQQNEGLSQLLSNIFESSGFSPINFTKITAGLQPAPIQPEQINQPVA